MIVYTSCDTLEYNCTMDTLPLQFSQWMHIVCLHCVKWTVYSLW